MSPINLNGHEVREGDEVVVSPTFSPDRIGRIVDARLVPWTNEVFEVAVVLEGEEDARWFAANLVTARHGAIFGW